MKFTTAAVAALKKPADKADHVEWDPTMPGFGVRLRGDSKTWLIQYRVGSQQRRESIGSVYKVSLEDARRVARQRFAQARLGVDRAAEKAKARVAAAAAALTLGAVTDRYLAVKEGVLRPSTFAAAKRYFATHWRPLRDLPLDAVRRADVAARLHDLTKAHGPVAAARARSHLSALFTWAMREGLVEANPTIATNDPAAGVKARERVLTGDEIKVLWAACRDDSFGKIVKLLLLTGARREEIGGLRWDEVDLDAGTVTITGERTKNGRTLSLPLPALALDILRSMPRREDRAYVFGKSGAGFGGWSAATVDLRARIMAANGGKMPDWRLHDLRRTMATGAAELGVQPHIVEACLNHVSGHKAGIAGVYNKAAYDREKGIALKLWADHLTAVVEGRKSKVVPLRA
jgi:integrase